MSQDFWMSDKHIFTTEELGTGICLMTSICFRGDKGFAWGQMLGFICIELSCHADTFDLVHPLLPFSLIITISLFLCLIILVSGQSICLSYAQPTSKVQNDSQMKLMMKNNLKFTWFCHCVVYLTILNFKFRKNNIHSKKMLG